MKKIFILISIILLFGFSVLVVKGMGPDMTTGTEMDSTPGPGGGFGGGEGPTGDQARVDSNGYYMRDSNSYYVLGATP